jgi:L-amino acid N-acyltransferase YncA/ribosomal protein S18 acetylase RimI-like enzyme
MMSERAGRIELAREQDVPAMLALSNWAAAHTTANFALSPERVEDWLAAFVASRKTHPWLVMRDASPSILGFAKATPFKERGAYRFSGEVSVYVDPLHFAEGVGTALYRVLLPVTRAQGMMVLLAGITAGHASSERLHQGFGFARCATFHNVGFKDGAWRDMSYWELQLSVPRGEPPPMRRVEDVWERARDALTSPPRAIIRDEPLSSAASHEMISSLNAELQELYPEPGATHFRLDADEVSKDRGAFLVAFLRDEPVACGAVRVMANDACELKRMFAAPRWRRLGLSRAILEALEARARTLGAGRVLLETGSRQDAAIAMYTRAGYARIPPFGEYVGSSLSVCMEKRLK